MAEYPSLPLWTDAYISDTAHLTDAEHGIYLQMLMLIWRSPQCKIPNDNKWIARRLRRSVLDVENGVRPLIREFCKSDGNFITQGRLLDEWNYVRKKSKSQSARAKSRWKKEKIPCPDDAGPQDPGNAPTPTPTPTNTLPNGKDGAPSSKDILTPYQIDKKTLFDEGVPYLVQNGTKEPQARSLIGKWVQANDIPAIREAIVAAQVTATGSPISYIEKRLRKTPGGMSEAEQQEIKEIFKRAGA